MDANIILGLGLYTIIGVAPLIYNYYVINKKHSNSSNRKIEGVGISIPDNRNSRLTSRTAPIITPINRGIRTPPVIVFVLNKNNLEDPEIRRLVITYLMREKEKEEATAVPLREIPLELGVRDIASARIQAVNTEGMAVMET